MAGYDVNYIRPTRWLTSWLVALCRHRRTLSTRIVAEGEAAFDPDSKILFKVLYRSQKKIRPLNFWLVN